MLEVLRLDAKAAPFTVVGTEKGTSTQLELPDGRKVGLFGIIDRKDLRDGLLHILDYKTGTVQKKVEMRGGVESLFEREGKERPTIAFQLLFYALLVTGEDETRKAEDLKLGVYALREIFGEETTSLSFDTATLDRYRALLQQLIGEILDPEVPFRAVDPKCDYCNFKILCGK